MRSLKASCLRLSNYCSKTEKNADDNLIFTLHSPALVVHAQLDIEVTFEYPYISKTLTIEDNGHQNEPFDCGNGGSAQRGLYGPFGLLVLTDDAFQEQTAVFFYISQDTDHHWVTHFCSDQSRLLLIYHVECLIFRKSWLVWSIL